MTHYYVELRAASGRLRRYSAPLFVTPSGLLEAFAETPDDCFPDTDSAGKAAMKLADGRGYSIGALGTLGCTRRFKLWREKVKGATDYKEPRTPLCESWELYQQGGWQALRRKYTRSHAAQLVRKFVDEGLLDQKMEIVNRFVGLVREPNDIWQLAPLISRAAELGAQGFPQVAALVMDVLAEHKDKPNSEEIGL